MDRRFTARDLVHAVKGRATGYARTSNYRHKVHKWAIWHTEIAARQVLVAPSSGAVVVFIPNRSGR